MSVIMILLRGFFVILLRGFFVIFGCAALTWGLFVFPTFWRQSSIENVATRILAGEQYKSDVLKSQIAIIESTEAAALCRPAAVRSAAIIRLRIAEEAFFTDAGEHIDVQIRALQNSIRASLACSPADPFLWMVLFWADSAQNGFRPEFLNYLRKSYQLGPNEGWIAVKRNPLAFAIFEELPPDLADSAINEFVALLNSGLYQQAFNIFTGPAWRVQKAILPRLEGVARKHREIFARALRGEGYEVDVPGVDPPRSSHRN